MKKTIIKGIVLSGLLLTISCNQKKNDSENESSIDKVQIKNEIQSLENGMAEKYNIRNSDGEVYYADDAVNFSPNKPPLKGKMNIDKSMKEDLAKFIKGDYIAFIVNEVFPSSDGNQVVELGSYRIIDSTKALRSSGNYMSLFEKRDGKYTCIRDMSCKDIPEKK
jgi:ketosteroid isomerase-like protein